MDTLRGSFGALEADDSEDVSTDEAPPPEIGADERRMQVRAYNFWASLLENRNYPSVEDLDPGIIPDFGPHGVLLDFSHGVDNPRISHLGDKLAGECGASGMAIDRLSDVPARSLLSRITDHYMQILANEAPIGFEAEFVNQRGATILYRGILLPFSSDDETIDFIYGVINWKELADARDADELLLEIDQALDNPERIRRRSDGPPMADWADGPGSPHDNDDSDLPLPSFGLGSADEAGESDPVDGIDPVDPSTMGLVDWLASARELARVASTGEERTRKALYEAISRAYDFSLAAAAAPQDFAAMLADAGLTAQERAPMTPVVKLVFGADYDKTRLTEYAAALGRGHRLGLSWGEMEAHLAQADGGLKGVVHEERRLRRASSVQEPVEEPARGPRKAIARKLRAIASRPMSEIDTEGSEFGLVMIRRTEDGDVVVLGEVSEDVALLEKAARRIVG